MTRPMSGWTQSFPRTWVTPRCASASIPLREALGRPAQVRQRARPTTTEAVDRDVAVGSRPRRGIVVELHWVDTHPGVPADSERGIVVEGRHATRSSLESGQAGSLSPIQRARSLCGSRVESGCEARSGCGDARGYRRTACVGSCGRVVRSRCPRGSDWAFPSRLLQRASINTESSHTAESKAETRESPLVRPWRFHDCDGAMEPTGGVAVRAPGGGYLPSTSRASGRSVRRMEQ